MTKIETLETILEVLEHAIDAQKEKKRIEDKKTSQEGGHHIGAYLSFPMLLIPVYEGISESVC